MGNRDLDNLAFVTSVQQWLQSKGYDLKVDGHAGPATRDAIRQEVSFELGYSTTPIETRWPRPQEPDLVAFYGPPGSRIVTVELPYPMRLAWDTDVTVTRTQCHELVRDSLRSCLEEVFKVYGSLDGVRDARMDLLGGVYNLRKMRGGNRWSLHAFGAAIDIDPERNGLNTPWPGRATMPEPVIEVFQRHGWTSLATVIGRDAMHFQATTWP